MLRRHANAVGATGAIVVLIVLPFIFPSRYFLGVLTLGAIYGIWAASWDFMSGLTGRENFGHALFIGTGAYAAGFLNTVWLANPWLSLPAAVAVAVAFSVAVGVPTLRLSGPYFALATLAAAAIMQRVTLIFWTYTGGEDGIQGIAPLLQSPLAFYYLALFCLAAVVATLLAIARSRWGLILRAIRGDEAACLASGHSTTFYKIAAFAISAAPAGLGGALYAHYQLQVSPQLFSVFVSVLIITMAYVGGIGSIYGAAGAAILLTVLTELLRGVGEFRLLAYSLVLIFVVFLRPDGLVAPLWRSMRGARE
ncbi:branched-chain amino acid ABC transporter permease [Paraburkholderia sp. GAS334]|uniref:branched-chain amino acid ABC transporter permease n=1 Tax=Paraburkholderia sp. GAS334 TaxID=3035131 RepID=UPI003D25B00C